MLGRRREVDVVDLMIDMCKKVILAKSPRAVAPGRHQAAVRRRPRATRARSCPTTSRNVKNWTKRHTLQYNTTPITLSGYTRNKYAKPVINFYGFHMHN